MKLLFDQNLSPRLIERLADLYPSSMHVSMVGLGHAFDREIWQYAKVNDFILITKDADYSDLSVMLGAPPKVV